MKGTTEIALPTLEERVTRLRAGLHSTPQGHETMIKLTPSGMVQTDQAIVNFTDWGQKSPNQGGKSR